FTVTARKHAVHVVRASTALSGLRNYPMRFALPLVARLPVAFAAVAVTLCGSAATAGAQGVATGTIKGTVLESPTQRPLADAQVIVQGIRRGGAASTEGTFTITGVNAGSVTLLARRVGYTAQTQTVTVTAGQTTTVVFHMRQAALSLDQVVVTGTANAT